MQLIRKQYGKLLWGLLCIFIIGGVYCFKKLDHALRVEDPIFVTAWEMLGDLSDDKKKINIADLRDEKLKSTLEFSLRARFSNLEYFYLHVLSLYPNHPSWDYFSINYKDLLVKYDISVSPELSKKFEMIDYKDRALFPCWFVRDYIPRGVVRFWLHEKPAK